MVFRAKPGFTKNKPEVVENTKKTFLQTFVTEIQDF
jgi:hypothetical protein